MRRTHTWEGDTAAQARARELRNLGRLAHLLDRAIPLPGGYRIGLDGIIGLIPGVGDSAGALIASYIVARSARLGVGAPTLIRMIFNVAIDTVVGFIPLLGDLFDFAWKANLRNVELLTLHAGESPGGRAGDRRLWMVVILLGVLVLITFAGGILLLLALLARMFENGLTPGG